MLFKKMLRNMNRNKGVYIACTFIIIVSILIFTLFSTMMISLNTGKDNFYTESNFADGFVSVKNMPESEVKKVELLKGIKKVEARKVKDVRTKDNRFIKMVGVTDTLNKPLLSEGIELSSSEPTVWLDAKYYDANKLKVNDKFKVIINGEEKELTVVGKAYSPEFVYALKDAAELYPDPEKFGIAFADSEVMDVLFSENGVVNDFTFEMNKDTEFDVVKKELEENVKKYGINFIVDQDDQMSNYILTQELTQLEASATSLPILFLCISSFILMIVLKRLIENERMQIGILKSFGYSNFEVIFHYMSYGLAVGLFGGIVGGILGYYLGNPMIDLYKVYFAIPGIRNDFNIAYFFYGIALSVFISMGAAFIACRKVMKLRPAEAMRPKAVKFNSKYLIEKIGIIWNNINSISKMALRNVFRNKGRSFFTLIGIAVSFAILGTPFSMKQAMDVMIVDQFENVQTHDFKIAFKSALKYDEVKPEFSGRDYIEGIAEIPAKLMNKNKEKDIVVLGIEKNAKMYNILDKDYNKVKLTGRGIILSTRLAKILEAEIGDKIKLESFYMNSSIDDKEVIVENIIPQYLGLNAYMDIDSLSQLLEKDKLITSVVMKADDDKIAYYRDKYEDSEVISNMESVKESMAKFETMMQSTNASIGIMVLFGIIIAFSVIYSSSLVSLSERKRELASLRLVGLRVKEVVKIISVEQWFIAIFGFVLGVPLLKSMQESMAASIESDLYAMPSDITALAVSMAFVFSILSIVIAQYTIYKKVKNFDLVEVLKERE
ncbi:MAG: FtsX-like permease family protein [Clostridia bacterium]|jgi:putative ABC transport system permease protein|nr:FtsX-like permease family protein [Clostridia bacterium]